MDAHSRGQYDIVLAMRRYSLHARHWRDDLGNPTREGNIRLRLPWVKKAKEIRLREDPSEFVKDTLGDDQRISPIERDSQEPTRCTGRMA